MLTFRLSVVMLWVACTASKSICSHSVHHQWYMAMRLTLPRSARRWCTAFLMRGTSRNTSPPRPLLSSAASRAAKWQMCHKSYTEVSTLLITGWNFDLRWDTHTYLKQTYKDVILNMGSQLIFLGKHTQIQVIFTCVKGIDWICYISWGVKSHSARLKKFPLQAQRLGLTRIQ